MVNIVQLNREDLRAELQSIFTTMQAEADRQAVERTKEYLLTPEETAELLKVSSVTLWRWDKSGYLTPVYVGGKKRYRNSDISKIMNEKGA